MGYKINGVELYEEIGFVADETRSTSNSFERPYSTKPVFKRDWEDEDGTEIDLVSPRFKQSRRFVLDGFIHATSEVDYKAKKDALTALMDVKLLTIYAPEIDNTVNATFLDFTRWERLTRIAGETTIVTRVTMEFDEVMDVALPTYDIWLGSSAGAVVTEADVMALNSAEWATELELETGTVNRFFHIVVAEGVAINSVTDLDAGIFGDVTVLYLLQGTVELDGASYNIYTMEVAIPYTTSHTHKFELSN